MDAQPKLAGSASAPAFEVVNEAGRAPVLLVCDHASRDLPAGYGTLGLPEADLARHIGWDIGAAGVTRRMAALLDAPAVLSRWSRLLVDCNRASDDPTFVCEISDGTVVPMNRNLPPGERERRIAAFYDPYHAAVAAQMARLQQLHAAPALFSVHSFTPVMRRQPRPWHVGILWNQDPRLAVPLIGLLAEDGALVVGDNQPYSGRANVGYTMRHHAARLGCPHVLVEIRQDLIEGESGQQAWAERLAAVLTRILRDNGPFAVEHY
jgi:predicted N-formylglutamate amidohydrolase